MRNTQVAEWILSLVTSPERAASTVGDLMESASTRAGFWLGVLRTALSLLWGEFAAEPATMMGLAFRGALLETVILVAFVICAAFVGGFLGGVLYLTGSAPDPNPVIRTVGWILAYATAGLLVPFQIGRWLARRAPGRELAPVVALTVLQSAITLALGLLGPVDVLQIILGVTAYQVFQIPVFVGAALIRRQRLSR